MKPFAILMIVAFLGGCAERQWTRHNATEQQFASDVYVCERDAARSVPGYQPAPITAYGGDGPGVLAVLPAATAGADASYYTRRDRERLAVSCMQALGWKIVE